MAHAYIAVARGHVIGIYDSWDDAKVQVDGYSNALYKGFNSRAAAITFLEQHSGCGSSYGDTQRCKMYLICIK